jgi:hypothetical protein
MTWTLIRRKRARSKEEAIAVLEKARAVVEKGWTQRSMIYIEVQEERTDSMPEKLPEESERVYGCINGALVYTSNMGPMFLGNETTERLVDAIPEEDRPKFDSWLYDRIARHLPDTTRLSMYNGGATRTRRDIVALFDRAIANLRSEKLIAPNVASGKKGWEFRTMALETPEMLRILLYETLGGGFRPWGKIDPPPKSTFAREFVLLYPRLVRKLWRTTSLALARRSVPVGTREASV